MLLSRYFKYNILEKNEKIAGIERIKEDLKEDLRENLYKLGIRTSFVQINLNADNLMIRLNIESSAR